MKITKKFVKGFLLLYVLSLIVNISGLVFGFYAPFLGYILIAFTFILLFLIFRKQKLGFWFELPKYIFLILLVLVTISSLSFEFIKPISEFLKSQQLWLTITTIAFGALTFWMNRDIIEKDVEDEKTEEEKAEERRKGEFSKKYPRINRIPVLRNIVKWMYKEGWWYVAGLVLIILLAGLVFSYNVGQHEFREDEFQVVGAAAGYYHTGEFYTWDWLKNTQGERHYDRAWPHTWMISQSYKVFGISEWSSRIISVLFGLIFIISLYPISKYFFQNKKLSLLICFVFIFNTNFINLFRYTRMYAVLIPIFLILFYLLHRGITKKKNVKFKLEKLNKFFRNNFNFNYLLLAFALILLYFNYKIHINSLIIIPIIFFYTIYLAIKHKEKRHLFLSIIGIISSIGVFLIYYLGFTTKFLYHLSWFGKKNYLYLDYLTQFPFFKEFGILLLLIGIIFLFIDKEKRDKLAYFYITILTSLIFFIWIANRYSGFLYISHIIAISGVLILFFYFKIIKIYKPKIIKIILIVILILILLINFYNSFDNLYKNDTSYGNFREAYSTIIENFDVENQVIFGQYLRTYYLKEIGSEDLQTISMLNNNKYEFDTFMEDLQKYESGYITFESRKGYHLRDEIKNYCCDNFIHLHGGWCKREFKNTTRVEVFYFNQSMINQNSS